MLADVCHGARRPAREPRDEIALFALEPAELTLDIEIQIAESPVGGQRSNQAGALVGRRSAFRPVPQTRSQGAPRLRQPWRDRLQQFSLGLPLRQLRAGHLEAAWCIQHQQHAPCGAECAHFINQQPMQFAGTAGRRSGAQPRPSAARLTHVFQILGIAGAEERCAPALARPDTTVARCAACLGARLIPRTRHAGRFGCPV